MNQTTIFVKNILIVLIIFFTVSYVPKLKKNMLNVFNKQEVRILLILLIFFVGVYDPLIALLLSMCFIRTHIKLQHYLKYKHLSVNNKVDSNNYSNDLVNLNIDNIDQLRELKNSGNSDNSDNSGNYGNASDIFNHQSSHENMYYPSNNNYDIDHNTINNNHDYNYDLVKNTVDNTVDNTVNNTVDNTVDNTVGYNENDYNANNNVNDNVDDVENNVNDNVDNVDSDGNESVVDELVDKLKITDVSQKYMPFDENDKYSSDNVKNSENANNKKDNIIDDINNSQRLNVFENFMPNF